MRILKLLKLAPLVTLVQCAHGVITPRPRAGDLNTQLTQAVWYPNPITWRSSPWFREDLITPARVVISKSNQACIMDNNVNEPREGEYYTCPGKWRYPRVR